ncbi:Autophagy-related protein [Lachnellula suecica]|uniref:Autophagy-related protein 27 n=1 Tax=Lachnellula suecica TaxID=602035 RepID=A0A8T9C0F6_9HELO|nr:Autophagy-related protein [Lachnellula suecica]
MRLLQSPADAAMLLTLLFPFLSAADGNFDCNNLLKDKVPFDFSSLGDARSVMVSNSDKSAVYTNTTYTIDLCRPLKRVGKIEKEFQCPHGTRLCAIEREIDKDGSHDHITNAFPIAGQLLGQGGYNMDAKWERLKASKSHADEGKEGLRLELNGGVRVVGEKKRKQKAIIEFLCDPEKTGLENLYDPEDKYDDSDDNKVEKREEETDDGDKGDGEKEDANKGYDPEASSLRYIGYGEDGGDASIDVLRLEWTTRHACEGEKQKEDAEKKAGWGFFTWFILIAFLSTATYLIFGSWLNYNRYGARGWDLLPHGDAIRDVPYLLKDWMRRVINTVQGSGGSRGGYAAV